MNILNPATSTVAGGAPDSAELSAAANKAINDLDGFVNAVHAKMALSKPWQRQFVSKLSDASTKLQILRLTLSLRRSSAEVTEAVNDLLKVVRQIQAFIAASRANEGARSAVHLAVALAQRIDHTVAELLLNQATLSRT